MKAKILLLLLLWPAILAGQGVQLFDTSKLFSGKVSAGWLKVPTDSAFTVLESSTGADTIYSQEIASSNTNGQIDLSFRLVKNLSGTLNAKLQVGLYRGPGVKNDNDTSAGAHGWEWHDLITVTAPVDTFFVIHDFSWAYKRPFLKYQYRILENGNQQNWYVLNNNQF